VLQNKVTIRNNPGSIRPHQPSSRFFHSLKWSRFNIKSNYKYKSTLSINLTLLFLCRFVILLLPLKKFPFVIFVIHLLLSLTTRLNCIVTQFLIFYQLSCYTLVLFYQVIVVGLQRRWKSFLKRLQTDLRFRAFLIVLL
jgi:hypothetical protein